MNGDLSDIKVLSQLSVVGVSVYLILSLINKSQGAYDLCPSSASY